MRQSPYDLSNQMYWRSRTGLLSLVLTDKGRRLESPWPRGKWAARQVQVVRPHIRGLRGRAIFTRARADCIKSIREEISAEVIFSEFFHWSHYILQE